MIVTEVSLYRYHLPLVRPLVLKNQPHHFREGLLLRVGFNDGKYGWGEIAPLPGFSRETLAQAEVQALQLLRALVGQPFPADSEVSLHSLYPDPLLPSVHCGISMVPINGPYMQPREPLPLNALLVGTEDEILARATESVNQGYRAAKLKVGMRTLEEDIALVYRVHARLKGKATLRLDANRAWTFEQAVMFGRMVNAVPIEYVEEPLQNPSELHRLGEEWGLSIALDESLAEANPDDLRGFPSLCALILKPTLLGSLARSATIGRCLGDFPSVRAVVSSSFESPVGLWLLAPFAKDVSGQIPAGLDTAGWFKESTLTRPLPIVNGEFDLSQPLTDADIRMDVLTEVFHA